MVKGNSGSEKQLKNYKINAKNTLNKLINEEDKNKIRLIFYASESKEF